MSVQPIFTTPVSVSGYENLYKLVNGVICVDPSKDVTDYCRLATNLGIYDARIINLLGGLDYLISLPILELQGQLTWRDYIDYLNPEDLSHSIMRGINNQRPFIAFRYRVASECVVEVLHQRYTGDPTCWTCGTNSYSGHQIDFNFPRFWSEHQEYNDQQIDRIGRLLRHEPVGRIISYDYGHKHLHNYYEREQRTNSKGQSVVALI